MNCEILGISFDAPADNKAFRDKFDFPFRLLSDVDQTVGDAYEAKRPADDPFPQFAARVSYLIAPDGRIAKAYKVTDVNTHPTEVLEDLRALQA